MRRVVWSDDALHEFERAIVYIADKDPVAAALVADRIDEAIRNLGSLATGHPGRVEKTFEKPVPKTPYIVAYAVTADQLTILRVIHGRRHWPPGNWPED
jgi:toxin ParE1/3/4